MAKNQQITGKETEMNIIKNNGSDYISLKDMIRAKDGDFLQWSK